MNRPYEPAVSGMLYSGRSLSQLLPVKFCLLTPNLLKRSLKILEELET